MNTIYHKEIDTEANDHTHARTHTNPKASTHAHRNKHVSTHGHTPTRPQARARTGTNTSKCTRTHPQKHARAYLPRHFRQAFDFDAMSFGQRGEAPRLFLLQLFGQLGEASVDVDAMFRLFSPQFLFHEDASLLQLGDSPAQFVFRVLRFLRRGGRGGGGVGYRGLPLMSFQFRRGRLQFLRKVIIIFPLALSLIQVSGVSQSPHNVVIA